MPESIVSCVCPIDPDYSAGPDGGGWDEVFAHPHHCRVRPVDGIPSLIDCEFLTIKGDVFFEKNVTIKGRVTITNTSKSQATIKADAVIDSDLIL